MTAGRYCESCGALLPTTAVLCGECGARYRSSPYERRGTPQPSAWASSRSATQVSWAARREEVAATAPGAAPPPTGAAGLAAVPEAPIQHLRSGPPVHAPDGPGHYADRMSSAPHHGSPGHLELAYPLDGCRPALLGGRFLAYLLDAVIALVVSIPLVVGLLMALLREEIGVLPLVLIGIGTALPMAYGLLIVWLVGAKGVTVGWKAAGLRMVREEIAGPLGFWRSLGRTALFGLLPPLFGLSTLWDPTRRCRGWHDRPVGAVLVDIRRGRDPFQPRPDTFERPPAEHFMPQSRIEVGAHKNLMVEPGSPWRSPDQAPPAPDPGADGWAPQPAPEAPPAVHEEPPAPPRRSPGTPRRGPGTPWPDRAGARAPRPSLDDLEQTRVTRAPARPIAIELDDGSRHCCAASVVLGRAPAAAEDEQALPISDATRSISKTHLRVEWTKGNLYVTDLGSTNGSAVLDANGDEQDLDPHAPRIVEPGARILMGEKTIRVERNG